MTAKPRTLIGRARDGRTVIRVVRGVGWQLVGSSAPPVPPPDPAVEIKALINGALYGRVVARDPENGDLYSRPWERSSDPREDAWRELAALAQLPVRFTEITHPPGGSRLTAPCPTKAAEPRAPGIVVPTKVLADVRAHADEFAPDGLESVGRLVVVAGRATRYVRMRNIAALQGIRGRCQLASSWRPVPGETNIVVHSHPLGGYRPSEADRLWACEHEYANPLGVYSVQHARLAIWRIGDGVAEVPVAIT